MTPEEAAALTAAIGQLREGIHIAQTIAAFSLCVSVVVGAFVGACILNAKKGGDDGTAN